MFTDVSEALAASILRAIALMMEPSSHLYDVRVSIQDKISFPAEQL
jgi:hypothetical protein